MTPKADSLKVSTDVRTAISNVFYILKLGQELAQSDVIRAIEEVSNVKSVVVPLYKMVKANGTQINREHITISDVPYQHLSVTSYSSGINALFYKTLGNVAADGFYAIFENDIALTLVADKNDVDTAARQGFISSEGEVIISTISSDLPSAHRYTVSYIVNGETGAKDIDTDSLEFLSLGELVITTV